MRTPSPERFRQIDALLDAVLDLPTGERDAFVDRATTNDPELRQDLQRRLDACPFADDFLNRAALELAGPLLQAANDAVPLARTDATPERVGPYRIVRELGHGGMGTVFLAERDDGQFEQRVALKLIRHAGAHKAALLARFLEERRILAGLEHPGIARLVDGGVDEDGSPWFAMEYVEGEPLDRYCDTRQLSVDQRLLLFGEVCGAVQYAHQHLVVHRDLKPSNVLVTSDGVAKLLDFGIAKLLDPLAASDADTPRTEWQAMTPEYAAPEQLRGGPVSTETDVYALGVVLYALTAGRRPYELRGLSPAEVERTVCEIDPPAPSSTFAADSRSAGDRAARAGARGGTPNALRRQLHGDLDAIVMQALRKDRARRYPSAAALLDDLRRFHTHTPVLARPDGAGYRVAKFALRHRLALSVGTTLVLLVAGGFARERALRDRAETEARKAKAVEAYVVGIFDGADPFSDRAVAGAVAGTELTARSLLDRGAQRVGEELGTQPEVQAEMRGVLSRVYTSLGVYDQAESQARQSLTRRTALYGVHSVSVAEATDQLGYVMLRRDALDSADLLLHHALATRRTLLGKDDPAIAESLDHLSDLYQEKDEYDRALGASREALALRRRVFGENDPTFASNLVDVALILWRKGSYSEAEPLLRRALTIQQARLGENAPATAQSLHNLAQVLEMRSQFGEAETFYRRALAAKRIALGEAHPSISINLNNLGRMLATQMERPDDAGPLIREALAMDRKMFGEKHSYVAASLNNLALVLRLNGNLEEAERVGLQSLAVNRSLFAGENTSIALALNDVAGVMLLRGNVDSAITFLRESRSQFEHLVGPLHFNTLSVSQNLARALREHGDRREAEQIFRAVATHLDSSQARQRALFIGVRVGLGRTLASEGRQTEALDVLRPALAMSVTQWKPDNWHIAEARLALGEALMATGRSAEAKPLLEESHAALDRQRRAQPRLAAEADAALAHLAGGRHRRG
ncbi:MAG: serine/threonine-protein kinase [Gemmatimonadota bacterium]